MTNDNEVIKLNANSKNVDAILAVVDRQNTEVRNSISNQVSSGLAPTFEDIARTFNELDNLFNKQQPTP
tara:strand:+ start:274 stop:480 length:207 start_codon:yes stop_codon:yes gene_type:complete